MSVIDCHGSVLLSTLIKPTSPSTSTATAVHGITDADVAKAPSPARIASQLLEVIGDKWLLAYNAPFDRDAPLRSADCSKPDHAPGRLATPGTGAA